MTYYNQLYNSAQFSIKIIIVNKRLVRLKCMYIRNSGKYGKNEIYDTTSEETSNDMKYCVGMFHTIIYIKCLVVTMNEAANILKFNHITCKSTHCCCCLCVRKSSVTMTNILHTCM